MSWITDRKWSVNGGLRRFSKWFDDFLLEVAKPLAIVGFAMGTVDIFTRGGIATDPWFNVPWAIVQATTIDGLFFAVWYRIFETKWKWAEAGTNLLLVFIGLILGLVAMITNGILSLQQLRGTSDSLQAMEWLGIDPTTFTIGRAVLVVFVSVMVAFVYHQRGTTGTAIVPAVQNNGTTTEQRNSLAEQWNTDWDTVLNSTNNRWNNWWNTGTVWHPPLFSDLSWVEHSGTVPEQPRTVVEQVTEPAGRESRQPLLIAEHSEPLVDQGSRGTQTDHDKLRSLFQQAKDSNAPINLVEVGRQTGIAYGRVRKLAPTIKREVGIT